MNPFERISKDVMTLISYYLNTKDLLALDNTAASTKVNWKLKAYLLGVSLPKRTTIGYYGIEKWKWACLDSLSLSKRFSGYKYVVKGDARKHRCRWPDGSWYKGGVKNSMLHGQGEVKKVNGIWYKGEFKNGKLNGQGELHMKDGKFMSGEFKNDILHGQGEVKRPNGELLIGNFENGRLQGQGEIIRPNGDLFKGEFKNGYLHGQGKVQMGNGTWYKGEFKNGRLNGQGEYYDPDTSYRYKGEFVRGERHGNGEFSVDGYWTTCVYVYDKLLHTDEYLRTGM